MPDRDFPHTIFFVRHGETDWNKELRYQGVSDVPLNDEGRAQARKAGLRLSKLVPSRVFSSPLCRALETAEIIMKHNESRAKIEPREEMREISFGEWEGLTTYEVAARYPEALASWRKAPFEARPPGGEPFGDVTARSLAAASLIKNSGGPGGVTFVVAHGAILRTIIGALMDISDMNAMWRMRLDNCSVSALELWSGRPYLLTLNDTNHARLEDGDIGKLSFP
jgi:alpha-ribazole phosphatase/probable phosphoglycerate mutase